MNYLVIFLRIYTLSFQPHAKSRSGTAQTQCKRGIDFWKGRFSESVDVLIAGKVGTVG